MKRVGWGVMKRHIEETAHPGCPEPGRGNAQLSPATGTARTQSYRDASGGCSSKRAGHRSDSLLGVLSGVSYDLEATPARYHGRVLIIRVVLGLVAQLREQSGHISRCMDFPQALSQHGQIPAVTRPW